jgi:60 kDa SS-A/Ro ribonucleoprotein
MAKFATKTTIRTKLRSRADAKDNLEGGLSFSWDDKTTLYMRAACSLVGEPSFYKRIVDEKAEDNFDNALIEDIRKVSNSDPEFILKLASYARHHLYLRSTPLLLAGEASQIKGCRPFLKKWLPSIISRADEPVELFSYVIHRFGRNKATSNNQLKKGVATALDKFNEYEFAKYNRTTDIKLKDVLRICHPKHKDLYKKIIDGTLATPETWEVLISNPESKGLKSKKEAWEYLVETKKLGYMATLRNLRNLIKEGIDTKTLDKALTFISDPEAIKRSRQLPFRYLSAYREVSGSKKVNDALETALEYSISNIPKLHGTTFIAADISGSMDSSLSERSSLKLKDVACLMAAMADKFCDDSYASVFATRFQLVKVNSRSSIIDTAERFKNIDAGGSTEGT